MTRIGLNTGARLSTGALGLGLLLVLATAHCGDDNPNAANVDGTSGGIGDGGGRGEGGLEGSTLADGAPIPGTIPGTDLPFEDAGLLDIDDVADTPCATAGGSKSTLYPNQPSSPALDGIGVVGTRRFATVLYGDGLVVFDANGNGATAPTLPFSRGIRAASTGADIVVFGATPTDLRAQRLSAQAAAVGPVIGIDVGSPTGFAVGGGGGNALGVWGEAFNIKARTIGASTAGPEFSLAQVSGDELTGAVAHADGTGFGVLWTSGAEPRTYFARTAGDARTGPGRLYRLPAGVKRTTGLVRFGQGFAGLLDVDNVPYLMILDDTGKPTGPVKRLLGTVQSFGLATSGGEIGVLAWRGQAVPDPDTDGGTLISRDAVEFRSFNAQGVAAGGWVCLGQPTSTTGFAAAITSEDNGYAVVWGAAGDEIQLSRFNKRGGVP